MVPHSSLCPLQQRLQTLAHVRQLLLALCWLLFQQKGPRQSLQEALLHRC
jgi:hypothetical protein